MKNNYYYFANQFYQFSNALPLYNKIYGTFIVRNRFSKKLKFVRYLRNLNTSQNHKSLFNIPPIIFKNIKNELEIEGIIFSQSNRKLHIDKKCISVFIGHGTGDKRYEENAHHLETYDYHFVVGPKQIQKLKDDKVNIPEEKLIKIGNMRFDDYVNNKIDKEKIITNYGIKNKNLKFVLYAPTWRFGAGTFKTHVKKFIKEISPKYNLIVRPHFHNAHYILKIKLWAKINGYKNVYFSNPGNLYKNDTMFDFAISDLMISDTSSILYEYLITNKPMIVVKNEFDNYHNMPDEMNIMTAVDVYNEKMNICELIDENIKSQKYSDEYKKMLHSCFYFNDGKSVDRAVKFIKSIE